MLIVVKSGYLEKFLIYFDKSIEFTEKLAAVEADCEYEYEGALLYKYIMIMVRHSILTSSYV